VCASESWWIHNCGPSRPCAGLDSVAGACTVRTQLVKLVSERQHLWCFSADLASCPPYAASVIVSIEIASLSDSNTVSAKPDP